MFRCWERYGNKRKKPEIVEEHLDLFPFSKVERIMPHPTERIRIWAPLIPISQNQGLPTFMEGSHRKAEPRNTQYNPVIKSGCMFEGRLRSTIPKKAEVLCLPERTTWWRKLGKLELKAAICTSISS